MSCSAWIRRRRWRWTWRWCSRPISRPSGTPRSPPRSNALPWSARCSTLSPWCAAPSSRASGCARKAALTTGCSSSSSSGRCACISSLSGSPPGRRPAGSWSRPELRGRYPDLPAPTEDELSAKMRLFEAVARLFDALVRPAPLILLLDDLHCVDGASLDLLRYLGRHWSRHGSPVLLLCTLRREGLEPGSPLAAQLADLGRDLPIRQVALQTLSQPQTLQLLEAIIGAESTRSRREQREHGPVRSSPAGPGAPPWPEQERPLVRLGHVLFAQTGGQPLYLLETLKLWRERQWLLPKQGADGSWKLEPTQDLAAALSQDQPRRKLVPPSVRELIQGRLAKLTQLARQLVRASAVLGTQASAKLLWQVAEVEVQTGVEALEEAIGSGMLREEEAGGPGVGNLGSYGFSHDLMRE